MKNAYIIIAHNNYLQLSKLISQLDYSGNDIFIHINVDADLPDYESLRKKMKYSSIYELPRNKMCWGSYGLLKSMLGGLKEATKKGPYDYYHVLSGLDIPLKSNEYINNFLCENLYNNSSNGKMKTNYVYIDKVSKTKDIAFAAHYNLFVRLWRHPNVLIRGVARRLNSIGYYLQQFFHVNRLNKYVKYKDIAKGSSWWSITDPLARYILSKESWIEDNFSRHTFGADETAIQTIVQNSPWFESLYNYGFNENMNMRCIDWKRGKPYIFRSEDYDELINSKYLFARKVDENIDSEIIDKIYEHLRGGYHEF